MISRITGDSDLHGSLSPGITFINYSEQTLQVSSL